jgi:hypothetical protein
VVQKDLRTLRQLLREVMARLGRSNRELEDLLGIGHGNLGRLLDGTLELRVRHLLAIADLMQVPASQLLDRGCPETTKAATRRLRDLIAWGSPEDERRGTEHLAMPASVEELRELLREEIRRELARSSRKGRRAPRADDPSESD